MGFNLAIAGATGVVGSELIDIINEQQPHLAEVGLFASSASAGEQREVLGQLRPVQDLAECDFNRYDAALFCIGDELSAKYVPLALSAGCAVVDKSNTYRLEPAVPLVVAGVNEHALTAETKLVANPNCTTIVMLQAVGPLHHSFGIRSIFAATYQSVSGAGRPGVSKLCSELASAPVDPFTLRPAQLTRDSIAHNVLAQIGRLNELGQAGEEVKLIQETRKILEAVELPVVAHAVRVPVIVGHSIAITVELEAPVRAEQLVGAWMDSAACAYMADELPTPLTSSRKDVVEIGRLRAEPQLRHGWSFFVCGDNLRIGAALNGWWILEAMSKAGAVPELRQAEAKP